MTDAGGAGLPAGFGLAFDPGTRQLDGGTVLAGGAPLRLIRLTEAGARLVDQWRAGAPVPDGASARALARRLVDSGLAHPRPPPGVDTADVTVVVPTRHGGPALASTLAGVGPVGALLVIDDGSPDPEATRRAVHAIGGRVLRTEASHGPAAARNLGWAAAGTPIVAFLDDDTAPSPGWLVRLLPHFSDPEVVAVAPRITTAAEPRLPTWIAAYEAVRSPLDRGLQEGIVRPRSRVPFVPTAALVVRRATLEALGGFDEDLRVGEDVDFVWRVCSSGKVVRYEPTAEVAHAPRASARAWLRQRFDYGTSAAPLAVRHGEAVAPLTVSGWSAAAWALALLGHRLAGGTVALGTTAALGRRLGALRHPWSEAIRLAGTGHFYAGRQIAAAIRRAWWPPAVILAMLSTRIRRALAVVMVVPLVAEWGRDRPAVDPVRWVLLRLADDAAYGAGVWAGCFRSRSFGALRPDFSNWPGHQEAVESGR